ncbi:MAG TPA: hypothetical protein VGR19_08690 [Allosphingosinicella sp.]|nr:hypothetical protein [Allosphingosinicella sp.]
MSNIPNSAMPHAGGNSTDSGSNAPQQSNFASGPSGSAGQSAGSSTSMQADDYSRGTAQGDRFSGQPLQQDRFSETNYTVRDRESGGVLEKARDHKTGIALGVAVGAIAAAAIPFMLSGKKKSNERRDYSTDHDSEIRVDNRTTSAGGSTKQRF